MAIKVTNPITPVDAEGIITIPGGPNDIVKLRFRLTSRSAKGRNEIGFFRVDDAFGTIGGQAPGSALYKNLALTRAGGGVIFRKSDRPGRIREFTFHGGDKIALYLVYDAQTRQAIAGRAPVYFSQKAANGDNFKHAVPRAVGARTGIAWEDLRNGGDIDYNDVVMNASFTPVRRPPSEGCGCLGSAGRLHARNADHSSNPGARSDRRTSDDPLLTIEHQVDHQRRDRSVPRRRCIRSNRQPPSRRSWLQSRRTLPDRSDTLFRRGIKGSRTAIRVAEGGSYYGFYLIADGTSDDFQVGKKNLPFSRLTPQTPTG